MKFLFFFFFFFASFALAQKALPQEEILRVLNQNEREWLQNLQAPITVGITQIPNQVLRTPNGYKGYAIDLFKIIESALGIRFRYVYYDTWEALLQGAINKEVDILFLAQKTERRLRYFNFTDIVLIQQNKILAPSKKYIRLRVENLFGKNVAVVKESAIAEFIRLNYPKISLVYGENELDILKILLRNEADYAVVEPVRASYYMEKHDIDSLYISGNFPYTYKLRIATQRDIPTVNIILNKVIENINPAEKKALALKWGYEKEVLFDKRLFINTLIVLTIVIVFLLYLWILNRKLKKAKESLAKINANLEVLIRQEVEKNRQKDLAMLHQSRYAQMGQVINMIAHQWRQPLNTVALIIQTILLKCKKGEIGPETLDEFKEKAILQIRQMSQTIDDFRDFFKQEKRKKHFDLCASLAGLLKIVEPVLEKSNIELSFSCREDAVIYGYANELSQAILNIIYNAKDIFTQRQKENAYISISVEKTRNGTVSISIKDNAGGIPEDIITKIFDPYFSTKGKNGTGMGLYMSKIIVEQHMQGTLEAFNDRDGAVFVITLTQTDTDTLK